MSWEKQFKVAIADRNPEAVIEAFELLPPLEELSMESALELCDYMEQGLEILKEARQHGANEIEKLRKIRQFVKTNPYNSGKPV